MTNLITIGPRVQVSFPKLSVGPIPAKVDTGADSSSIWASNITEKDGVLAFRLFGRKSPFYTGETIRVTSFRRSLVKNSFGVVERRYKVKLQISLSGRNINA